MAEKANNRVDRNMIQQAPCPTGPVGVPIFQGQSLRHAIPFGSHVLTAEGDVPAERIAPGARVITRDKGMAVVRDVLRLTVANGTFMVLFPAGALGRGRPERDLILPIDQPVALRDWRARTIFGTTDARVAALRLADGTIIREVGADGRAFCALVLDRPSVLYVDGMEVVSGATSGLPVSIE